MFMNIPMGTAMLLAAATAAATEAGSEAGSEAEAAAGMMFIPSCLGGGGTPT